MSVPETERLYGLLPAIYRLRDAEQGAPLRALLAVIEGELRRIEDDIGALYDNWFIETCDEWVVPYIGDLLGVRAPSDEQHLVVSQRARVANTIAYRHRKGIASTLEQVIYDATGWHARVVELFQLVAISQHAQRPRPHQGATVDVRDLAALGRVASPFDSLSRRVDVRPIAGSSDRQSPANVGLFVWRLQSYPITLHAAPSTLGGGRYCFHPLGKDVQLFNRPQPPADLGPAAQPSNLPGPIDPLAFAADLAAYQTAYQKGASATPQELRLLNSDYYGPERGLYIADVSPMDVIGADLSTWETQDIAGLLNDGKRAAVDVRLGRLVLDPQLTAQAPLLSYHYGFAADIGGGPYDRRQTLATPSAGEWLANVARGAHLDPQSTSGPAMFADLREAIEGWASQGRGGIIQILDSEAYDLPAIELAAGRLVIQAADGAFPSLRAGATLAVRGADAAALTLSGVRLDAAIALAGQLRLEIIHASIPGGISSPSTAPGLQVTVASSIVGPLRLPPTASGLAVRDSIVDGGNHPAITGVPGPPDPVRGLLTDQPGPPATLERATVFGDVRVAELRLASETIFAGAVGAERPQTGGLRYCYVPPGSRTPPRYRCQPDLEIAARAAAAPAPLDQAQRDAIAAAVGVWLAPRFSARAYGEPGYGQLAAGCPAQIALGAEDGSEMGAFYLLHQPKRAASLRAALDEYLPAGLDAGVFYAT